MTDIVSDMLTRIRNAVAVEKETVAVPYSAMNKALAEILQGKGFINQFEKKDYELIIDLAYSEKGKPAIKHIKRVSKPGRRIYEGSASVPLIYGRKSAVIVSTSKGLMTARQAKKEGLGGEIVCEVW